MLGLLQVHDLHWWSARELGGKRTEIQRYEDPAGVFSKARSRPGTKLHRLKSVAVRPRQSMTCRWIYIIIGMWGRVVRLAKNR